MTTTMNATESLERIQASAEAIRNADTHRFPDAASVGDTFRQGDLYITRLDAVPAGAVAMKYEAQLAPGNTQGSRHILDRTVKMYRLKNATVLDGPVIEVGDTCTVTHPEHGHVVLPAGIYGVTYQRQFADELRRVAD